MRHWMPYICVASLGILSSLTLVAVEPTLWVKQILFVSIGILIMKLCEHISFTDWLSHRWWLYGASMILLLMPFLFDHSSRNTARWIDVGIISIQPSQLALPFVALVIVSLAASRKTQWERILQISAAMLPPLIVVFLSPDLGTTLLLLLAFSSVFWFGRFSLGSLFLLFVGGMIVIAISWLLLLRPYQKERLISYLEGSSNTENIHYNALQSHIAIGSGGLFGQGFGEGSQVSLAFLPESHTDFWFAAYAEQSGLVGVVFLFTLYSIICGTLLLSALKNSEEEPTLFIYIFIVSLTSQVFVNSGMNLGLLPITGVTLPFLSYGGSSFISMCIFLGIALSASHHSPHTVHLRSWYNLPSALEKRGAS